MSSLAPLSFIKSGIFSTDSPVCSISDMRPNCSETNHGVTAPAHWSNLDPVALGAVFSCLFCEFISNEEKVLLLHLTDIHRCHPEFSCTDCPYTCNTRELFTLHSTSHLGNSQTEIHQEQQGHCELAVIKEETSTDQDNNLMVNDFDPQNFANMKKGILKNSRTKRKTVTLKLFNNGTKRERTTTNTKDMSPKKGNHMGWGKNPNLNCKAEVQEQSKINFKTFEQFLKVLVRKPLIIKDMSSNSFSNRSTFPCPDCKYVGKKFSFFKDHFQGHRGLASFICKYCNAVFTTKIRLRRHQQSVHAETRAFSCNECDYTGKTQDCLHKHKLNKHAKEEELKYYCTKCPARFALRQLLFSHQISQHKEILQHYFCDLCNFSSARIGCLRRHLDCHLDRSHLCPLCGKTYSTKHQLHRHIRNHSPNTTFHCDQCSYETNRPSSLRDHYRIHTKEKPYVCDICNAQFSRRSNLQQHSVTHDTKPAKHTCRTCGKSFKRVSHLKRHEAAAHGDQFFECSECDYVTHALAAYQRHQLLHDVHKRRNCNFCPRFFATPGELNNHMQKVHPEKEAIEQSEENTYTVVNGAQQSFTELKTSLQALSSDEDPLQQHVFICY